MIRFAKFLATGGTAALANLASRVLLEYAMPFEAAVVVAYLIGMATAYVLARLFVFDDSGRSTGAEFTRFAIVNVVSLCIVWVISVGLARVIFPALQFTWHANDIAHFIGVLAPAVVSYVGHSRFTFAPARDTERFETPTTKR
jgi:putative flippase GtrA